MQMTINRRISLSYSRRVFARGVLAAVGGVLNVAAQLLLTWQSRARQRADLAAMSDRMLADIGVSRLDAMHEAAKPFWMR